MKKNNLALLFLLFLLTITSIVLYNKFGKASTIDENERSFKVTDTASITKIFMADKEGNQATIERKKNAWIVNGKYSCRTDAILNLLEAVRRVEVETPVPKTSRKNVLKSMSSLSIKVEIYAKDELIKQYYVGHEPPGSVGSYMLLTNINKNENYETPFICFIPGFTGFLKPRFICKESEWRDRLVINFTPPQLNQIALNYTNYPDSSFTIDLKTTNNFELKDGTAKNINFDQMRVKQYLAYYLNISYEALVTIENKKVNDSLSKTKPFAVFTLTTNDLKQHTYRCFRMRPPNRVKEDDKKFEYDPDRFYLNFDSNKEWAVAQYFVFGKLLATPPYFYAKTNVKK
ncbi:MAG: hypothetical protein JSU07_05485 [Bacteroidetes bacterium]|nr:hypothetical protein [Bacteroidota bacterium]